METLFTKAGQKTRTRNHKNKDKPKDKFSPQFEFDQYELEAEEEDENPGACPHFDKFKSYDSAATPTHCHCPQPRKFTISFENTVIEPGHNFGQTGADGRIGIGIETDAISCAALAKQKCKAFWAHVDTDPKLQALIKDGKFNQQKAEIIGGKKRGSGNVGKRNDKIGIIPVDKEVMRIFAQNLRARRAEARQRLEKRRAANNNLILKSGQPTAIQKLKEPQCKSNGVRLAASEAQLELPTLALHEMKLYDHGKIYDQKT